MPPPDRASVSLPAVSAASRAGELSARVADVADPAGTIWHDGAFHRDAWIRADDGEPLSSDALLIVALEQWLAERSELARRDVPLALLIAPGEGLDDVAGDLGCFALIALAFPKFSDGRAFSTARLLREKHGYEGELRAVGNVLSDQIPLMRRVGFDSFEVMHLPTRRALAQGRIAEVSLHYQPATTGDERRTSGARPWIRWSPQRS